MFTNPENSPFINQEQAAKRYHVCTKSISNYRKEGMPHIKLGARVLFDVVETDEWVRNRTSGDRDGQQTE